MVNEKDLKMLNVTGAESWNGIMGWKRARKPNKYQSMRGFEGSDNCTYMCGT